MLQRPFPRRSSEGRLAFTERLDFPNCCSPPLSSDPYPVSGHYGEDVHHLLAEQKQYCVPICISRKAYVMESVNMMVTVSPGHWQVDSHR
jgi:hypothetical protein